MVFDGSEKLIGRGAQADVLSYRGYAYKIYKPSYPAEWIAFESLASSVAALLVGIIWKGNVRRTVTKNFLVFAIAESVLGCLLGLFLAFVYYNVWLFAIVSLIYSAFITTFVSSAIAYLLVVIFY